MRQGTQVVGESQGTSALGPRATSCAHWGRGDGNTGKDREEWWVGIIDMCPP